MTPPTPTIISRIREVSQEYGERADMLDVVAYQPSREMAQAALVALESAATYREAKRLLDAALLASLEEAT